MFFGFIQAESGAGKKAGHETPKKSKVLEIMFSQTSI
jgi:hypothetical protein